MVSRATWQTPICDADAALRQLRFLMVVLSTAVSRYASPRPRIGEYLTGLDSAFVPSPDSPGLEPPPSISIFLAIILLYYFYRNGGSHAANQTSPGSHGRPCRRPHQGDAQGRNPARLDQQAARDRDRRIGGNRFPNAQRRLPAPKRTETVRARGLVRAPLPFARCHCWRRRCGCRLVGQESDHGSGERE